MIEGLMQVRRIYAVKMNGGKIRQWESHGNQPENRLR
jgi:hypothetical protein